MRDNDWDEQDITDATKDVRVIYETYRDYWNLPKMGDDNTSSEMDDAISTVRAFSVCADVLNNIQMSSSKSSDINIFDKMELDDDEAAAVVAAAVDELDLYLTEPRVKGITDVLRWWALNAGKYPILSRVALDKLACPRTSFFSLMTCY